ncbi:hypothetical protein [Rhizobium sp. BK176]|uniref:hypothetical protein n=1 Tax=Rhizobium sp. BK176 TaxID=2587071 RepID=UPI00216A51CD|nr:hypothetical protein [Rhizobium sp. BK176]MCS4088763.1 hypothetical protein [Rhizobium sp. BK176]
MQISIKLPVMARAFIKGARSESRLLVSQVHQVDVPSVSAMETEVPIRTVVTNFGGRAYHGMRELRLHDGKLYRYLGINAHLGKLDDGGKMLSEAFGDFGLRSADFFASTEGRSDRRDYYPLTKPIRGVIEDRLDALSMNGADIRNRTWPKLFAVPAWENEAMSLDAAMDHVQEVNRDDLEEAFAMHRAQADRLLMIDNELWYETTPPCIAVETQWRAGGKPSNSAVIVRYRHLPETMDHAITTTYYPISAYREAHEAADEANRKFRMAGVAVLTTGFERDNLPAFAHGDHPAFQFDQSEDLVRRTGHALAVTILRNAVQRPDKFANVGGGWLSELESAFATFNPLLGRDIDYAARLPALAETFLAVSPYKTAALSMLSYKQVRKAIEVAVEQLDNLPISVHGLATAPARAL